MFWHRAAPELHAFGYALEPLRAPSGWIYTVVLLYAA
jgi:hypothetical protein